MVSHRIFLILALLLMALWTGPVHAGLDEAAAYYRGDYAVALEGILPAAKEGDLEAQAILGLMYDRGQGVAKDDAQAVFWYRKAATQGHAGAQNALGLKYTNGEGVAKDDAKAVILYRKAAEQGYAEAQYSLGYD